MATASSVLNISDHMPKVIGPKAHGIIDYCHAAFFFGMALAYRKNKAASMAALGTGAFVLVSALLTDYPLGWKPVISFETHGKMDTAFASASWLIPKALGFSGTTAAKIFESNSAVEGTVVSMTDFSSQRARTERMLGS